MGAFIEFALLGLGTGALYAFAAQGLVLVYRASGVLNFANGAVGIADAFFYWELYHYHHWPFALAFIAAVALPSSSGAHGTRSSCAHCVGGLGWYGWWLLRAPRDAPGYCWKHLARQRFPGERIYSSEDVAPRWWGRHHERPRLPARIDRRRRCGILGGL